MCTPLPAAAAVARAAAATVGRQAAPTRSCSLGLNPPVWRQQKRLHWQQQLGLGLPLGRRQLLRWGARQARLLWPLQGKTTAHALAQHEWTTTPWFRQVGRGAHMNRLIAAISPTSPAVHALQLCTLCSRPAAAAGTLSVFFSFPCRGAQPSLPAGGAGVLRAGACRGICRRCSTLPVG